jgi:nitrate/nitrite transporter NarK
MYMASPGTSSISDDAALSGPWQAYSLWASTARYHKAIIDKLTTRSLQLSIGGAILATASEQMARFFPAGAQGTQNVLYLTAKSIGVLGAVAVTLAAYFSRNAQGDNRVRTWIRCRSAAESLKSGLFLYRARVDPFDGVDRAAQLSQRIEKTIADLKDVEPRHPEAKPMPSLSTLTVAQYIQERVKDQIEWYNRRARELQAKADSLRTITSVLAGVSALLTLASAVTQLSLWVPVIATISASITAHLKSQQYQMLIATYSATALRLNLLCGNWESSGKTDADTVDRNSFIKKAEETMSAENGSWSALWETK